MEQIKNNAVVKAASVTQTAAPELGIEEKQIHYLIIQVGEEQIRINTGKATVDKIQKMTQNEKQTTPMATGGAKMENGK